MKRVALRAEYRTENVFNEGYICISEDGKEQEIEGVFGLDYLKIIFTSENTFDLILYENIIKPTDDGVCSSIVTTIFESQMLYVPELTCPEQYLLSSQTSLMRLNLLKRVQNDLNTIFNDLESVRI